MIFLEKVIPFGFTGLSSSRDVVQLHPEDTLSTASNFHLSGNLSLAYQYYHLVSNNLSHKSIALGNLASIEYVNSNYSKCLQLLLLAHQFGPPNYGSFLISVLSFRLDYYLQALSFFEYRWLNSYIPLINQYLPVSDTYNSLYPADTILVQDGGLGDLVFASRLRQIFNCEFPLFFLGDKKSCNLLSYLEPTIQTIHDNNLSSTSSFFKSWIPIQSFMRVANYPFNDLELVSDCCTSKPFDVNDYLDLGLFWQGNEVTELFMVPGSRSIPLRCFSPLFFNHKLKIHSLQVGPGINQISENHDLSFEFYLHQHPELISDFSRLSKYLIKLDAIITTDSFIANFAGWLGIKSMVIVSRYCDWRWVRRNHLSYSYWYPTIKVFEWDSQLSSITLSTSVQDFLFNS